MNESTERSRRACNVVLYSVPEAPGDDSSTWDQHDVDATVRTLQPIRNFNKGQIYCSRMGEFIDYSNRRPLCITLPTAGGVGLILRNKYKLLNGISAKAHLTSFQISHRQELWNQIRSMKAKGIHKQIKFKNNTPVLVDAPRTSEPRHRSRLPQSSPPRTGHQDQESPSTSDMGRPSTSSGCNSPEVPSDGADVIEISQPPNVNTDSRKRRRSSESIHSDSTVSPVQTNRYRKTGKSKRGRGRQNHNNNNIKNNNTDYVNSSSGRGRENGGAPRGRPSGRGKGSSQKKNF